MGINMKKVRYKSADMSVCKDIQQRRLQKAFLRYHDEKNWPLLRKALRDMGRSDLIGSGAHCLVPAEKGDQRTGKRSGARASRKTPGKRGSRKRMRS